MNPVDIRLGKSRPARQNYAERAQKKRVWQTMNKLIAETDWRGDLARSVREACGESNERAS